MFAVRAALVRSERVTIWRNNSGFDRDRKVRFGLGIGSADLVGLVHGTGRFVGVEVKTPSGRLSPEQRLWGDVVERHGGLYVVARSVDDALAALDRAAGGATE